MVDSSDSNTDRFEIRQHKSKTMRRKHEIDDDDEVISGAKAMLKRRKQPKKTMMTFSPSSKMIWTKSNELDILRGIVDYAKEKGLSYGSDWDVFYGYVKGLVDSDFSKQQLMNKVRKLKKRFRDNHERSKGLKGCSFADTYDEELFGLSMIIWGKKNETECGSNENMQDQPKVLVSVKDVPPCAGNETECGSNENMQNQPKDVPPCAGNETECGSNENMQNQPKVLVSVKDVPPCAGNETECGKKNETECGSNENMQNQPKVLVSVKENETECGKKNETECGSNENMQNQPKDVPPCPGNEQGSDTGMEKGKKKSEEDGVDDEFCGLQDALEDVAFFQALSKNQQKQLRRNLKNLPAQRRKELTDEWNALLDEEMKLSIKRVTFSAKIANAGISA